MSLSARTAVFAAVLGCVLLALIQVAVGERMSPLAGLALPVAMAVVVVIWREPIRGVQLALLSIPMESLHADFGSFGLSTAVAILLVTAVIGSFRWVQGRVEPWVPTAFVAMCALIGSALFGFGVAQETLAVAKILVIWVALTIVGVMVANASLIDRRRMLWCLTFAAGITGAIAVSHGAQQEILDGGTLATNRAEATFSQPNVLAFFLVLAIPVAIVLTIEARRWARVLAMLAAALAIAGLVLTLSRTGLLGGMLSLCVMLLWQPFRRASLVALAALLAFGLFNLTSIERSPEVTVVGKRLSTLDSSGAVSNDPRSRIYTTAPKMFFNNLPFGVGEGNFEAASARYDLHDPEGYLYEHAHDVPLTIAVELGIPGLIAIAWMWCAIGVLVIKAIKARARPREGPIGLATAASVLAILPSSIGDYPVRTDVIAATFLILIGILAASVRDSHEARGRSSGGLKSSLLPAD
jgi:O-antigen ligase